MSSFRRDVGDRKKALIELLDMEKTMSKMKIH